MDSDGNFDFEDFAECVYISIQALNEVLDEGLPLHPLDEQQASVRDWRQTGLGIMGVADMLIKMGVAYGSDESIEICRNIAYCLLNSAVYTSANLAAINGYPFPKYSWEKLAASPFFRENISEQNKNFIHEYGLYNSQLLTIAPTGTLSTMLGISGGVEPIFANYYERKTESLYGHDKYFKVYTPIVKAYMEAHGIEDDKDLPDFFVTSADIEPHRRVLMQAAWQRYIDASISSTVNLPESATAEDIANIYFDAAANGLKGITVFRSGCRRAAILSTGGTPKAEEKAEEKPTSFPRGYIIDASDNLVGKKRKLITGCGSLHIAAFFDPESGDLLETYLSKGSTGGCNNFMVGLSRMISLAARGGCGIDAIIDQLNSSGVCPSYAVRTATRHDTSKGSCCPVAIGNALREMWREMRDEISCDEPEEEPEESAPKEIKAIPEPNVHSKCPECGEPLVHEGGCDICKHCGWSKCN